MNYGPKLLTIFLTSFLAVNTAFSSVFEPVDEAFLIPQMSLDSAFRIVRQSNGLLAIEDCETKDDKVVQCTTMKANIGQAEAAEIGERIESLRASAEVRSIVTQATITTTLYAGWIAILATANLLGADLHGLKVAGGFSCLISIPFVLDEAKLYATNRAASKEKVMSSVEDILQNGECKAIVLEGVSYERMHSVLQDIL